jgi:hypothetical protein
MPIQINKESGGKLVAVYVSGKLAKEDYEHIVPERVYGEPFPLRFQGLHYCPGANLRNWLRPV